MIENELKNKILSAIEYAKNTFGITLVKDDWGSKNTKCACPLGCLLLANDYSLSKEDADFNTRRAREVLGVSENWINGFINGFDGTLPSTLDDKQAWDLGTDIRAATNPINHIDYINDLDPEDAKIMGLV